MRKIFDVLLSTTRLIHYERLHKRLIDRYITKTLHVSKAHGHYNIWVRMIRLCRCPCFVLTLLLIHLHWYFKFLWMLVHLLPNGKKANIVPIHKKNDKQIVSNYRPVSPLRIFRKIFEKFIFDKLFKFFEVENLLCKH